MAADGPESVFALLQRATARINAGETTAAAADLRAALTLNPAAMDAFQLLGSVSHRFDAPDVAVGFLRRALTIRPHPVVLYNLGVMLTLRGDADGARRAFTAAAEAGSGFFPARFSRALSHIPILYRTTEEIAERRAAYIDDLRALERELAGATPAETADKATALGVGAPFFLAYQGLCDKEPQRLYGSVVHRLAAARYPDYVQRPAMPPPGENGRLRVGVLSGFISAHSNWKMRIAGWLESLDRDRFDIYAYYTRDKRDRFTEQAERLCRRFVQGPLPVERWAAEIRRDDLHILILPEIGMDLTVAVLAALRLAPVQATTWGHPDTSGLPTVDCYLSSDLMEPPDADDHYTEKLVRLPNLSVFYRPPDVAPETVSKADLGLREDAVMLWCCQSFAKYLPGHDRILARIARNLPDAQFVFIEPYLGAGAKALLQTRLETAFAAAGVAPAGRIVFLPMMSPARFLGVCAAADVMPDTFDWSGCNTTLEALSQGTPVVTLPGALMRGRHSYAILKMIGADDLIARDEDDYVSIVCRLARDRAHRAEVSARLRRDFHRVCADRSAVAALETFIAETVRDRRPPPQSAVSAP